MIFRKDKEQGSPKINADAENFWNTFGTIESSALKTRKGKTISSVFQNSFFTRSKKHVFMGIIVFSALAGLILTSMVFPYTLLTAGASEKTAQWWEKLPHSIDSVSIPEQTTILDKNGKKIATLTSVNRKNIHFDEMPETAINALVATEDSRFFEHNGMDPRGIGRAFVNNLLNDNVQGASTITQQLVENLRLQLAGNDKDAIAEAKAESIVGKIEEVRFAQGIESNHSKEDILETYFNIVYFGNGAYGIHAAADRYFSKKAKDLNVPQAATLIAMLKSPVYFDPIAYPERSEQRRNVVMKRMVEEGYLEQEEYIKFIKKPTKLKQHKLKTTCGESKYPFYCRLVEKTFLNSPEFGDKKKNRTEAWKNGGYVIKTPLDPKLMKNTQQAVDRALGKDNRVAAGVASIVPGTGEVAAIAQNRSWGTPKKGHFDKTQIVYADSPQFQVGSTFKPITVAAALEDGVSASIRINASSPQHFSGFDEPTGGFRNDGGQQFGNIDTRKALKYSVNNFFVGLTHKIGVNDVAAMARRLGMKSVPSNLTGREGSITLGSYESDPIELASVYATLAARGVACDPVIISSVKRQYTGQKVRAPGGNCHQEVSQNVSDTVSDLLLAPFTKGGTAAKLRLNNGRKSTGKTGTTNDSAATWFSGYTPQLATSVWIGDPRGGTKHPVDGTYAYGQYHGTVFGGTIAGPIWKDVMNTFHKGKKKKWFPKPGGVSASMASRIVPDVQGMYVDSAVSALLDSGFNVKISKKNAKRSTNVDKKNYVVSAKPKAGRKAAYGDTITLTLTNGSNVDRNIPRNLDELKEKTDNRKHPDKGKDERDRGLLN